MSFFFLHSPTTYFGKDVSVEKLKMYHPDFLRYTRNRWGNHSQSSRCTQASPGSNFKQSEMRLNEKKKPRAECAVVGNSHAVFEPKTEARSRITAFVCCFNIQRIYIVIFTFQIPALQNSEWQTEVRVPTVDGSCDAAGSTPHLWQSKPLITSHLCRLEPHFKDKAALAW